jgi:hypothetical protein
VANISPGVYSKIIDLSTYVQAIPSTIGFLPFLSEKGRDNQLIFIGGRSELISEWGEPNIQTYGKNYGQGPYIAYNYLGESGALFGMRCLSENATYSNMIINGVQDTGDSTASISITYQGSVNSYAEIKTALASATPTSPICMIYPIGRGQYYNGISLRFTQHSNPMINDVYVLDVYEKQSDDDDVIIESFQVSFDPTAVDLSGDSIWISYILNNYSGVLRCEMELASGDYTGGYDLVAKVFDKNIGNVTVVETALSATITDDKQLFTDWETDPETGNASYMVEAKDAKGNTIYGWIGAASGSYNEVVNVFNGRNLTTADQSWVGDTTAFDTSGDVTYRIKKTFVSVSTAFISATPVPLRQGSDGDLLQADGSIDVTEAKALLAAGYAGTLLNPVTGEDEDSVLDTENTYYSMVFDAGYPSDVKTQISTLVQTRRDCVAIIDNGDNATYNLAMTSRANTNVCNNFYTALYESFNKVYDTFTGQDIWVSPVYHMAYILPRNDNVAELWYAAAGFNRAAIDSIKELRYSPKLGQRDRMYLNQLNPIVKFSQGYVMWGQLTSQSKSSALSDLNIVRLVLYIKRAFETFCRSFIFEMNDAITWNKVSGEMKAFLEQIKRKRGLDSYSVEVGATDYEKKTKTFHANVTLQPTRVVERIELNFFIV